MRCLAIVNEQVGDRRALTVPKFSSNHFYPVLLPLVNDSIIDTYLKLSKIFPNNLRQFGEAMIIDLPSEDVVSLLEKEKKQLLPYMTSSKFENCSDFMEHFSKGDKEVISLTGLRNKLVIVELYYGSLDSLPDFVGDDLGCIALDCKNSPQKILRLSELADRSGYHYGKNILISLFNDIEEMIKTQSIFTDDFFYKYYNLHVLYMTIKDRINGVGVSVSGSSPHMINGTEQVKNLINVLLSLNTKYSFYDLFKYIKERCYKHATDELFSFVEDGTISLDDFKESAFKLVEEDWSIGLNLVKNLLILVGNNKINISQEAMLDLLTKLYHKSNKSDINNEISLRYLKDLPDNLDDEYLEKIVDLLGSTTHDYPELDKFKQIIEIKKQYNIDYELARPFYNLLSCVNKDDVSITYTFYLIEDLFKNKNISKKLSDDIVKNVYKCYQKSIVAENQSVELFKEFLQSLEKYAKGTKFYSEILNMIIKKDKRLVYRVVNAYFISYQDIDVVSPVLPLVRKNLNKEALIDAIIKNMCNNGDDYDLEYVEKLCKELFKLNKEDLYDCLLVVSKSIRAYNIKHLDMLFNLSLSRLMKLDPVDKLILYVALVLGEVVPSGMDIDEAIKEARTEGTDVYWKATVLGAKYGYHFENVLLV